MFLKKHLKTTGAVLFFGLALTLVYIFGYKTAFHSWNEKISISYISHKKNSRGPAANQGEREVATVSNIIYTNPQSLFDRAYAASSQEQITFFIGNIIVADKKGNKNFVCQTFPKIKLFFEAEGVFIKGEPISMAVLADCQSSGRHQFIGPFHIPSKQILQSPITQDIFSTPAGDIHFQNAAIQWPQTWILRTVIFESDSDQYRISAQIPETEDDFFSIEF